MPTFEARVPTPRASRYLAQLCSHAGHLHEGGHLLRRHSAPAVLAVHVDGATGVLEFADARCTVTASDSELVLRAESADADALARVTAALGTRIERAGHRDGLRVVWQPV
jgi:hypothetical protein